MAEHKFNGGKFAFKRMVGVDHTSAKPSMISSRLLTQFIAGSVALLTGLLLDPTPAAAANLNSITAVHRQDGLVVVEYAEAPGSYFLLQFSSDLKTWQPADMSLGFQSTMELASTIRQGFFRAIPYDQYAPLDTDGDGIDDIYELQHPGTLDPLNPNDASHLAPGASGLTNYQEYLRLFGITSFRLLQRESREVSVFNFGSPSAAFESISREQSLFNFGNASAGFEANSRELSLYNGESVPVSNIGQIESREWSLFNFSSQPATVEANSREISLYNGLTVPVSDLAQIETREVTAFNFGSPTAATEAHSREVSVLNFTEP